MYAKLVSSGAISPVAAIRDIGRLITSASPNVASLGAYSTSSSIVIDPTPANWTYVGSNNANDQPYIANTSTTGNIPTTSTGTNLCFSSPTLANNSILKYTCLTTCAISNAAFTSSWMGFCLTGAQSATSLGVVTNETGRTYTTTTANNYGRMIPTNAGTTLHLIANPQHITLVWENNGIMAVWESSQTDAHTFYGIPPFVAYSQPTGTPGTYNLKVPTAFNNTTPAPAIISNIVNITDTNTGTNYGTYDVTENGNINNYSLLNAYAGTRTNSLSASGLPTYQISPIYYGASTRGYPTQFVTGVVPIYWCGSGLGNSGDTVAIGSDTYYYLNSGNYIGVLMKTS